MLRSEHEPGSKLDRSWNVALAVAANKLAKLRGGRIDHRIRSENWMIERVEGFGTNLQIQIFADRRVFRQGNLELIAPAIAKVAEI